MASKIRRAHEKPGAMRTIPARMVSKPGPVPPILGRMHTKPKRVHMTLNLVLREVRSAVNGSGRSQAGPG